MADEKAQEGKADRAKHDGEPLQDNSNIGDDGSGNQEVSNILAVLRSHPALAATLDIPITARRRKAKITILNKRIRRLQRFARPDILPVVFQAFSLAVENTRQGHTICEQMATYYQSINKLAEFDTAELLLLAKRWLDSRDADSNQQDPIASQALARVREVRAEVIRALTTAMRDGANDSRPVGEIIDVHFADFDDLARLAAPIQATLVISRLNSTRATISIANSTSALAIIYEDIFYSGILDWQGSKLDRKILFDKLREVAQDMIIDLIPGAGTVTKLASLVMTLFDLESELDKKADDIAYLETYITSYNTALEKWLLLGTALADSIHGVSQALVDSLGPAAPN